MTSDITTITFNNTAAYGRCFRTPFPTRGEDGDEVPKRGPRYTKENGSVKGLHYRKYIGLELLSENNFALTFHKFYSNEIKNLIRSI
jgi:hypothetical protein